MRHGIKGLTPLVASVWLATTLVGVFTERGLMAQSLRPGPSRSSIARNYFPLKRGYRWVYVFGRPGTGPVWEVKVESEDPGPVADCFLRMEGYVGCGTPSSVCSRTPGEVIERSADGKEYLWYSFDKKIGERWVMHLAEESVAPCQSCEDGATLWISARDEVVSVPAGVFQNVIRVDHIPRCFDGGIVREWFAPGVGLIRREQTSFFGPYTIELVYAELGETVLPKSTYSTSLHLSSPRYVHDLTNTSVARLEGSFVIGNQTETPTELVFSTFCKRLRLEIRNEADNVVIQKTTQDEDLGCPAGIVQVDLRGRSLVVPFSLVLADSDGKPLPDGSYRVTGVLLSDPENSRPAATASFAISSVR